MSKGILSTSKMTNEWKPKSSGALQLKDYLDQEIQL